VIRRFSHMAYLRDHAAERLALRSGIHPCERRPGLGQLAFKSQPTDSRRSALVDITAVPKYNHHRRNEHRDQNYGKHTKKSGHGGFHTSPSRILKRGRIRHSTTAVANAPTRLD